MYFLNLRDWRSKIARCLIFALCGPAWNSRQERGGSGESKLFQRVRTPRQGDVMVSEPLVKPCEDAQHLYTLQASSGLMLT